MTPPPSLTLYDLCAGDADRRFSPYCWRARMALRHKGLAFDTVPVRFSDKALIAFSGQDKVPVLVHDGLTVHDSWAIACHLESAFPDRPSLFGGGAGMALSRFHADWATTTLNPAIMPLLAARIHAVIHEDDKPYFRASREQRLGATLEAFTADRESHLRALRKVLAPLRAVLAAQSFLGGASALYADYAVFGSFMWASNVGVDDLLDEEPALAAWLRRVEGGLTSSPR